MAASSDRFIPLRHHPTTCKANGPGELEPGTISKLAAQPGFSLFRDGSTWRLYKDPVELLVARDAESLNEVLSKIEQHVNRGGEAAGFFGYEAALALEPRLHPLLRRGRGPLSAFGLYATCSILNRAPFQEDFTECLVQRPKLLITYDKYCAKLATIRRLIEDGEVYQINFTTGVQFKTTQSAWELFGSLFSRQSVPYAAFLNLGADQIVSLSPELFFQIDNGVITVRPMKGTAARGLTLEHDIACAKELRASEKNRAENVMIVDLMRSDLGRICRIGSVKTTKLFEVERYPSLWQMTSVIQGKLVAGCTIPAVVRALFPSGSVTGAPKIRAMEHISLLEDSPRGVYTGAVGFFAPGHSRFSVAIRTVALHNKVGTMGVGSGITYDSVDASEWEECGWKTAFLTQTQPQFKILETLQWNSRYRHLEAHLKRMRDSAEYFCFPFPSNRIRNTLLALGRQLKNVPQRVRVTLARNGKFEVANTDLTIAQFGRVRISDKTVSTQDRFLYHKTTNRFVYDQELSAARKASCDDALLFNEKGQLTEGTIHNVFVVRNGIWRTPPVACGLLPGICRAHILRKRSYAIEAVLTLSDLTSADKIYLCNSIRGLSEVALVLD